jgi:hypothetical protein
MLFDDYTQKFLFPRAQQKSARLRYIHFSLDVAYARAIHLNAALLDQPFSLGARRGQT